MKHLVIKAQRDRDADSFIRLMEMNRQSMLKVAKSYLRNEQDVADAMQEAILSCYEKLDTLQKPQYFKTWLIRIVINKCKDILRRSREAELPGEFIVQETYDTTQEKLEFMELLNSIDEKYRMVLVLYYSEGFNTREIAELLEINEHTVKSRLVRARKKFALEYQKGDEKIYAL
ncbi:MAG: sigma-70 family RNA polymerase sigma factor [Eubacteriales bacterium]|nr:sigma-70 family RNA polymerase sigma factor [Eubacteriales bacterium]